MAELDAWLAFQQVFAWKPVHGLAALARCGAPSAALRQAGVAPPAASVLGEARSRLRAAGAVAIPIGAAEFPATLAELCDAPSLLHVRGEVALLCAPAVAVVGSRAASLYGLTVARALGACFARAGLVVVSGLARGIDAAAHVAALDAGGRTLAVQACGPDLVYPPGHGRLAQRIVESGGALVTEFPPGTPPRAAHFPLRNRLISALSRALVVVEARDPSGSLVTAGHAAEQGRDVFAVPGPLGVATSTGTNRLLRDGAHVLLSADDVLQLLGLPPGASRPESAATDPLPRTAAPLLRALATGPATRDELARRLRATPDSLCLPLLELELAGAVAQDRDGRLRLVGPQRAAPL